VADSEANQANKPNAETDRLGLIQTFGGRDDIPGLLKKKELSAQDGFALEIFRGEKWIGEIVGNGELTEGQRRQFASFKVQKSDVIYRVYLGRHPYTFQNDIPFVTRDDRELHYRIEMSLSVVNPGRLTSNYRQATDPVRILLNVVQGELRKYTGLHSFRDIRQADIEYRLEHIPDFEFENALGLQVSRVYDVIVYKDKHQQNITQTMRELEIERIKQEAALQFENRKAEVQRANTRLDKETEIALSRDLSIANYLVGEERVDIRDLRASGKSIAEIAQQYPAIARMFPGISAAPGPMGELVGRQLDALPAPHEQPSSAPGQTVTGEVNTDRTSPVGTGRQKMDHLNLRVHGLSLLLISLSERQLADASHESRQAFLVSDVQEESCADLAGLSIGDIVVGVNGEPVSSEELLADALRLRDHGGQIRLSVLRGRQIVSLILETQDR
jgi:hypothetical protein